MKLGAYRLPWSSQIRGYREPQPGMVRIVADRQKAVAADAAYLNAMYGHGFEYDDYIDTGHPRC
jgi:hypothetical protein